MKNLFEKYSKKDLFLFAGVLDTLLVNIIILFVVYLAKDKTPKILMYLLIPFVTYNLVVVVSYLFKLVFFDFENKKQEIWLNIIMIITALLSSVFSGLLYIIISLIDFPF